MKCIQCGTCSASCAISPSASPFPRKEMARATLGMKDALLCDPDIWLCHQCNDCTRRCPRGARPGDVLAAIRKESIFHFAMPSPLCRWIARPIFLPFAIALPALLLGLTIQVREQLASMLDIPPALGSEIVYSHSAFMPHWLLNRFFLGLFVLAAAVMILGTVRFWRAMKVRAVSNGEYKKVRSVPSSLASALGQIWTHRRFAECDTAPSKSTAHFLVVFGFLALMTVTSWVITATWNPLVTTRFVYPFSFFSPFKILANLGGAAVLTGSVLMIGSRLTSDAKVGTGTYFDWLFLLALLTVVVTGFATEGFHYLRLSPHRHVVYFVHLVSVAVLLFNLPFTKFAHIAYRTAAIVFALHIGREDIDAAHRVSSRKGEGNER